MVVPVPVVLQESDVKTLPQGRVRAGRRDGRAAPRRVLGAGPVQPARRARPIRGHGDADRDGDASRREGGGQGPRRHDRGAVHGRRVPDRDPVGEGLDRARHLAAPGEVQDPRAPSRCCGRTSRAGSKFFVAKVDPTKVKFEGNGRATLSPLRFHYDSDEFALPIRLGLVNSAGTQDLIVNILAPRQRYEVANYPNVTIPTNLDVKRRGQGHVRRVLRGAVRSHAREEPGRGGHRVRVGRVDLRSVPGAGARPRRLR